MKQLSVFELVIILTLGSAPGDPLFYEDVGLIPTICVFIFIMALYPITTFFISRFQNIEKWLEGEAVYLIEDGQFSIDKFEKEFLAQNEFFAEQRLRNVTHIGQVNLAILETSGQISIFFYDDSKIKPGLPILPNEFMKEVTLFLPNQNYACKFCANICSVKTNKVHLVCERCNKDKWVVARHERRIA